MGFIPRKSGKRPKHHREARFNQTCYRNSGKLVTGTGIMETFYLDPEKQLYIETGIWATLLIGIEIRGSPLTPSHTFP